MSDGAAAVAAHERPAGLDVVRTPRQARLQPRPPLLVLEPLEALLDAHGLGKGDCEPRFIGDGHSNVTLLVVREGAALVLRRPPRPPYSASAHDVLREARILRALANTSVPVPRVLLTCEDASVIGAPFYVMDYVEGEVVTKASPPALDTPGDHWRMGTALVDALAVLHDVDPTAAGLGSTDRGRTYLERQLRVFSRLWEQNQTRNLPLIEEIGRWLAANRPADPEVTLVHGDFRIGNVMFARTPPVRLLAIFDWEMATLGDPLADLGYLTATYAQPDEPLNAMTELSALTAEPGFPERADLARRYRLRTGRSLELLPWYQVLALWKSCVFLEGSFRRYLEASTDDPWFAELGAKVPSLAEAAWQTATEFRS